ncbi:unnamed protein product [Camellia sinensis]
MSNTTSQRALISTYQHWIFPLHSPKRLRLQSFLLAVLLGITLPELDILDTFGQKHSGGEGSIPASTSDNSTAAAYKDPQISIHGSATKKKRVSRIIGGGLRQFSIIICKKVEGKGKATYSEVFFLSFIPFPLSLSFSCDANFKAWFAKGKKKR